MHVLWIALGGAVGTVLRYGVSGWAQRVGGDGFPTGTLAVNVSGAFAVGFLATFLVERTALSGAARGAVLIGLLGGYTTFSTFSAETLALTDEGEWAYAAANVFASVASALVAVWLGRTLAQA